MREIVLKDYNPRLEMAKITRRIAKDVEKGKYNFIEVNESPNVTVINLKENETHNQARKIHT